MEIPLLGLKEIADQIFFLGYGGMVLMAAVERLKSRRDCVFLWGIDDGPYGQLAQTSADGVKRSATVQAP
jgi:hypothetical protein